MVCTCPPPENRHVERLAYLRTALHPEESWDEAVAAITDVLGGRVIEITEE